MTVVSKLREVQSTISSLCEEIAQLRCDVGEDRKERQPLKQNVWHISSMMKVMQAVRAWEWLTNTHDAVNQTTNVEEIVHRTLAETTGRKRNVVVQGMPDHSLAR